MACQRKTEAKGNICILCRRIFDPEFSDGYHYTIFGKEFCAGNREQYKLMYDTFRELTTQHPDCAEKLTQRKSVAKSNEVSTNEIHNGR